MLWRLAHFAGGTSGLSPQQSALVEQSRTWQVLPVPVRSKFDGWHDLFEHATPVGQSWVAMQDKSASQSFEESHDEPRAPSLTGSSPGCPAAPVSEPASG